MGISSGMQGSITYWSMNDLSTPNHPTRSSLTLHLGHGLEGSGDGAAAPASGSGGSAGACRAPPPASATSSWVARAIASSGGCIVSNNGRSCARRRPSLVRSRTRRARCVVIDQCRC